MDLQENVYRARHIVADCITVVINIRMADKPFTIDFDELKMHINDRVPEYRIYVALGALERIGVIEFDEENLLIRVNYNFIYGYRDSVKRRWYDEYEGKPIMEKLDDIKSVQDKNDFNVMDDFTCQQYMYIIGRLDQQLFSAGYL